MRIRSIHQSLHVDKTIYPEGKIEFQPLEDVPLFEAEVPAEVGEYLLALDAVAGKDREGKVCPKGDFIEVPAGSPSAKIKRANVTMMLHPDEQELVEFFRSYSEEQREDMMDSLRRERDHRREAREERKQQQFGTGDGQQQFHPGDGGAQAGEGTDAQLHGQGVAEIGEGAAGKGKKKAQGQG